MSGTPGYDMTTKKISRTGQKSHNLKIFLRVTYLAPFQVSLWEPLTQMFNACEKYN